MGDIRTVLPPAKLVFGLLVSSDEVRQQCLARLTHEFGQIDHESRVEPFAFTNYYNDEMGESILRQYVSSSRLIEMADLTQVKHLTNQIEVEMARVEETGQRHRQVNIDPGYLNHAKMVLATTKDYNHRIYVADGIFEEATLYYQRPDGFRPFPWTYPDYARPEICEFFNKVRDTYRRQIRATSGLDETPT